MALTQVSWPMETWKPLAVDFSQRIVVDYSVQHRPALAALLQQPHKTYLDMNAFFEHANFEHFVERVDCLIVSLKKLKIDKERTKYVVNAIKKASSLARVDLGINFDSKKSCFYPTGAKLLDERLVNEELRWLSENQYTKVYEPFEKGLRFLLEAKNDSSKLQDVVTDLYEALETFAKIVCDKPNGQLSKMKQSFLKILGFSKNPYFQEMFNQYCDYAHAFRHGKVKGERKPRPPLDYAEVEAFVYLTGLFIRLGMQKLKETSS